MQVGHDGAVIVADVRGDQQPPRASAVTHVIKVRVPDVNAQFERARSRGARVLQEPTEYEYGERECTVEDLGGHRWQFTQTIRDVDPEEWGGGRRPSSRTAAATPHPPTPSRHNRGRVRRTVVGRIAW